MNRVFATNESEEVLESLAFVDEGLNRVGAHPYRWKWVIIGVHNALQSSMVIALQGTWSIRVKQDSQVQQKPAHKRPGVRNRSEIIEAQQQGIEDPYSESLLRMKPFTLLYANLRDEAEMRLNLSSRAYIPQDGDDDAVEQLNEWRNRLVHFEPLSLSITERRFTKLTRVALRVIHFALFESNNIVWRDDAMAQRAEKLTCSISARLELLSA